MEGILGVVGVVFTLLAAPRLGWEVGEARKRLLITVALFALGMVLPALAVLEGEAGWVVAGHFATAIGVILYFLAVLDFKRSDAPS